jgi:hypothetical protein
VLELPGDQPVVNQQVWKPERDSLKLRVRMPVGQGDAAEAVFGKPVHQGGATGPTASVINQQVNAIGFWPVDFF